MTFKKDKFYFKLQLLILLTSLIIRETSEAKQNMIDVSSNFYLTTWLGRSSIIHLKKTSKIYRGKFNNSYIYGAGVGYDFGYFRSEINYILHPNLSFKKVRISQSREEESQKIKSSSLMLNFYKDFYKDKFLSPYILLGIGITKIKSKDFKSVLDIKIKKISLVTKGETSNSLTLQFGAGVGLKLQENLFLDFKYIYTNLGKVIARDPACANKSKRSTRLKANEFFIGFRVKI